MMVYGCSGSFNTGVSRGPDMIRILNFRRNLIIGDLLNLSDGSHSSR